MSIFDKTKDAAKKIGSLVGIGEEQGQYDSSTSDPSLHFQGAGHHSHKNSEPLPRGQSVHSESGKSNLQYDTVLRLSRMDSQLQEIIGHLTRYSSEKVSVIVVNAIREQVAGPLDQIGQKVVSTRDYLQSEHVRAIAGDVAELLEPQLKAFQHASTTVVRIQELLDKYETVTKQVREAEIIISRGGELKEKEKRAAEDMQEARQLTKTAVQQTELSHGEMEAAKKTLNEANIRHGQNALESNRLDELEKSLAKREQAIEPKEQELKNREFSLEEYKKRLEQQAQQDSAILQGSRDAKAEAERLQKEAQTLQESAQRTFNRLWPAFLAGDQHQEFRAKLVESQDQTSTALLSALHLFTASFEAPDEKESLLFALNLIGQLLYRWYENSGCSPEVTADCIALIAGKFNTNARDRYKVQIARPGQSVIRSYMAGDLGITTVSIPKSWAVFYAKDNFATHSAHVT